VALALFVLVSGYVC